MSGGSITFGLVNIPVKLYPAANPKASVSFKLLSPEGHRLKQQYVDPKNDDAVVPRSEMKKGYEVGKDRYVLLEPEELAAVQERSTGQIEIDAFIPEDAVPRAYFDKTYYLGPDKGGDRPYALLAKAMRETKRCGLAKYAARGKQHLVLIAPAGESAIALHQLHYADELVDVGEVPTGDAEVKDAELALATQIIDQIASDRFEPDKYEDEVRKRVEQLIEKKLAGEAIVEEAAPEPADAGVTDLMAMLKASLSDQGEAEGADEDDAQAAS